MIGPAGEARLTHSLYPETKSIEKIWTQKELLSILDSEVSKKIFSTPYISEAFKNFSDDNRAALLHFNGITSESNYQESEDIMMTVAAFHRKDEQTLKKYLHKGVSACVRLDYGLPIHHIAGKVGGEDRFVEAVKVILGGDKETDISIEDKNLENYVQNSFKIGNLLEEARNKTVLQPTPGLVEYLIAHAKTYQDSNHNPAIVFIPGIVDLQDHTVSSLIEAAVENGCDINAVGFFNVPPIVWSIIMGDVESVKTELRLGARLDIVDTFGNKNVLAWAIATQKAVDGDKDYANRMGTIIQLLKKPI